MDAKSDIELYSFFIFNSEFGNREGEEQKKILFYYPDSHDLDTKIKNIGFVEAIIQFAISFKPDGPINSVHTQKRRQLYFEAEEKYWVVMTLALPFLSKKNETEEDKEYLEEDVQDQVYQTVLKQSYFMYRLFNGNLKVTVDKEGVDGLRTKLNQFFPSYINSLKLRQCDILNVLNGMQYLPLDKQTFLQIQCFINTLESKFPIIDYVIFLYNDHLVWSGIEPHSMQIIYQYLITTLLPASISNELLGGSNNSQQTPFNLNEGRFITGPENLKTATTMGKVPKLYLYKESEHNVYYFVAYRALSATICMFIKENENLTLDTFKRIHEYMAQPLPPILSSVAEYCNRHSVQPPSSTDSTPKFIYFNRLNLAYKSTVHLDNKQSGNVTTSKDCIKIMNEMHNRKHILEPTGETVIKTQNDHWVINKISNMREFYVAMQMKDANVIVISDEVKKLCESELQGIYFNTQ